MTTNQQIKAPVKWTQKGSGTRRLLERRSCDPKGFHGGLRFFLEWDQGILQTFKVLVLTKILSINRKTDARVLLWTVQSRFRSWILTALAWGIYAERSGVVWADYRQDHLQSGNLHVNFFHNYFCCSPLKFTIHSLFVIFVHIFAYDLLIEECSWRKLARLMEILVWYEKFPSLRQ